MKRVLLIFILVLGLSTACGGESANGERVAIEDTIRGYVTTWNAQDFAQCLTYFTGYGDEEEALAALSYMRGLSGELELREIGDIAITNQTATATVVFTISGEEGTDELQLKKVDGHWKIVW
jgi:hypothetical protein